MYGSFYSCLKLLKQYRTIEQMCSDAHISSTLNNRCHFYSLARFGCSTHKLAIEEGRYRNQERNNRICEQCNLHMIENEFHFLLICPSYTELRNTHIPRYYRTWPTLTKFKLLIDTNSEMKIRNLATFLYHAFKKRNSQQ